MTNQFETTYTINTIYMNEFNARIEATNKIAKRLDVAPITVEFGELYSEVRIVNHVKERVYYVDVTISGEYPSKNGWSFLTQLDHASNLIRSNSETNHRHLLGDTTCDHCNSNRQRNVTYVIKNEETKEEMRVGGSCLKYYLPTKSIDSLATFYVAIDSFNDEDSWGRGSSKTTYNALQIVTWAAIYVEHNGAYHGGGITRQWILNMINVHSKELREERDRMLAEYDYDKYEARAKEILEWVSEQEATNDFMHNVISSCGAQFIEYKQTGFIAAAIVAFNKAKEREILAKREAERKAELPESEHVGTVKKRENFTVTLEKTIVSEGYYGDTFIHRFRDAENNLIIWFGSKRLRNNDDDRIEAGEEVTIKATVKEHSEFRDEKQTIVQRVAFVA
ncbi:hypothetical protein VPFG_00034 [Vibrio phage nt-1]|uniref:Uncharacterized protein n=1 Tax=Vibrio phage nt-1 TaxID=115992 RepID=R9TF17_9CAUD|nr:hypothetical protein VPFG_00034 [Vibrio phage nt-1]AGN30039.1 hypothetical protein VPFG_00034 [Vibrio phage nt-1]